MPENDLNTSTGATQIFHMPSADSTIPDLLGANKPSHPTLTIVKGPQIGETFELDTPVITLGRDVKSSVFLNDMDWVKGRGNWKDCNLSNYSSVLSAGDIIFCSTGHVAIYAGGSSMIHAPSPGGHVCYATVYACIGGGFGG